MGVWVKDAGSWIKGGDKESFIVKADLISIKFEKEEE